jgi:hypothetical protein
LTFGSKGFIMFTSILTYPIEHHLGKALTETADAAHG